MISTRIAVALLAAASILQAGGARPQAAQQAAGRQPSGQAQGAQGGQSGQGAQGAAAQPAGGQQDGANSQQPIFRGGINFVRVDVIVSDKKAQPVTDLKLTDFEVTEDGKPQNIEQFSVIKIDGNPKAGEPPPHEIKTRDDEEAEAAKDDVRMYAILLDDYHVRQSNSISIREPLTKFIENQLRPKDMVALMYPLTPVDGISFTRNQKQIISAINQFEGRKFDYRPRNQIEEQYSRYPTDAIEKIRNDISMGALRALATRLGGLREGRKAIIYVSEGFTALLPPQLRRQDASQPQPINPGIGALDNSPVEQTAQFFSEADTYSRMRDVFEVANRNNAAIYSLDPRGLAVFEFDINDGGFGGPPSFQADRRALQSTQDTLRTLSEETDGRAIVNRNTLLEGLNQIVRDSSFYYLLGYNSSQAPTDGKFHEIKVRVKRPNVDVRARKGYWAATEADISRATNPTPELAKPIQQALASIGPALHSARVIRTWVGTTRGDNGKTRVTLVWEPLPPAPGEAARRERPGRVSVLAATEKGDLVFRGRSPDAALASTAAPAAPSASAATAPQRIVFDSPPGKVELRLSVEAAGGGGTLDNETRTIDVPDLTTPQSAISTPRVFRARTAREFQTMAADSAAIPVIGREFSRSERLLIRFDVYAAGNEQPMTTAAVLNRAGQKMSDVPVAPAPLGGTHQIDLGLNTLAPGDYLVEITAKGSGGEVKELLGLRVGS